MKPPVSFYCLATVSIPLLFVADLLVDAAPARGEEQVVSHKSAHHTHHHGKAAAHHHASEGAHGHAEGEHGHKQHHAGHRGEHHNAVASQKNVPAASSTPVAPPQSPPNEATPAPTDKGSETGLPLPRFASLRADRVYMRRGPGERYPIDWVYHRRNYPVKIEREFGVWRLVEDPDGQKGWVHQVTLRGSRSFVIPGAPSVDGDETKLPASQHADPRVIAYLSATDLSVRSQNHDVPLMSSAGDGQKIVAVLQPGTVGTIKACPQGSSWCHVTVRGYDGWLNRQLLWGVQPGEIIQPD